jgi:hypothetical protein
LELLQETIAAAAIVIISAAIVTVNSSSKTATELFMKQQLYTCVLPHNSCVHVVS